MKKIKFVCVECGSGDELLRDAWAAWSVEDQRWELAGLLDMTSCPECGEVAFKKVKVPDGDE